MKSKKNWYTLLEIMIVLGVIIILLTVTMKFSSSRIDELQSQTSREDFKNNYEELLLSNMSSNYYNGERYTSLDLFFGSWAYGFTYTLINETKETEPKNGFFDTNQTITKIIADNEEINALHIILTPYTIGCELIKENESYQKITLQTETKNQKYCFSISNNSCKLVSIPCL